MPYKKCDKRRISYTANRA